MVEQGAEDRFFTTEYQANYNWQLKGGLQELANDSADITLLALSTLAILYAAPQSISQWSEEDKDFSTVSPFDRWTEHVQEGPLMDSDKDSINYLGHPYFGAIYYAHARSLGVNRLESFIYVAFMSTFLYEYGFEAFMEVPSTQDLIVTPLFGAFMGELFLWIEKEIEDNDNKLLGSQFVGNVCLYFINPLEETLAVINAVGTTLIPWVDRDVDLFVESSLDPGNWDREMDLGETVFGFRIVFSWGRDRSI